MSISHCLHKKFSGKSNLDSILVDDAIDKLE